MAISMYSASIPVFMRMLDNLDHVLDKAGADAAERKIDPQVYVTARLAPDMFALARPPKYDDTEATLPELKARVRKTIDYLATFKAAQIDGTEDREIILKGRGGEMRFKGLDYLLNFVVPNFYFHYTTTYDILRHNGVKLGKGDFTQGRAQG
jgi:hypothetical protein